MKFLSYYERYLMKNISGKYFIKICVSSFLPVSPPPPPPTPTPKGSPMIFSPGGNTTEFYPQLSTGPLGKGICPQLSTVPLRMGICLLFTLSPLGKQEASSFINKIISSNEDATLTFLTSPLIPNLVFVGGGGGLSYLRHILDLYWVFNKLS